MARNVRFARPTIEAERRPDGVMVLRSHASLGEYPVFTEDGEAYLRAVDRLPLEPATRVVLNGQPLAELAGSAEAAPRVDAAFERIGPDTVAKILFPSGSTGAPKG